MSIPVRAAAFCALLGFASAAAQEQWVDRSPHRATRVSAGDGVELEVLDWGDSGRPVVLLAGAGNTGHVFDDIAPKLASEFRVLALTRRGFGASDVPSGGYEIEQLAADVLSVIDGFALESPLLIGHSLGGDELTMFAGRYPHRAAGLVYLDGAFDRSAPPPARIGEILRSLPRRPDPSPAERRSYASLATYMERVRAARLPEGEILASYTIGAAGFEGPKPIDPLIRRGIETSVRTPDYSLIKIPALALNAVPGSVEDLIQPWYGAGDAELRARLAELFGLSGAYRQEQRAQFENGVARSRAVDVPGADHFVFISDEARVLEEIRKFAAELPAANR